MWPLPGEQLDQAVALKAGKGHVLVVRRDDRRVAAIRRRPVDETLGVAELGRVDGRLEQPQHPDLSRRLAVPGVEEGVAAEKPHVGRQLVLRLGRQQAGVHRASILYEA